MRPVGAQSARPCDRSPATSLNLAASLGRIRRCGVANRLPVEGPAPSCPANRATGVTLPFGSPWVKPAAGTTAPSATGRCPGRANHAPVERGETPPACVRYDAASRVKPSASETVGFHRSASRVSRWSNQWAVDSCSARKRVIGGGADRRGGGPPRVWGPPPPPPPPPGGRPRAPPPAGG